MPAKCIFHTAVALQNTMVESTMVNMVETWEPDNGK